MKTRYYIQKIFGKWLSEPIILPGKTTGFSLVRSVRSKTVLGKSTKIYSPFSVNNVVLGDYSYIARNSNISNTAIGKFCSIGPNFCCGLGLHPTNGISTSPMFYSTGCQNGTTMCNENKCKEMLHTTIGNDVFIGANVTVLDGVNIADGAVIGAGAVVVDDIPPYAIAVGVPAKVIKYRFSEEKVKKLLKRQWWNDQEDDLPKVEQHFWNVDEFLNG